MKKIKLTVAQALLKFLNNQYISVDGKESKLLAGVMGIFGHGNAVGLGQALEEMKDEIKFIPGKNEQDIAHVCMGYAKQKRRYSIYACTASIGPGSVNMVTAAANATVNRIPLLLLPADTFSDRQPDPALQQIENAMNYTVSVNDSFKPVCKYWDRVSRPEQLMSAALNAVRVLTDPAETGAVCLSLPQDVQGESYEYPESFFDKKVWFIDRIQADDLAIARAVEMISKAKNPFIIAGGGVYFSGAGKELVEFSEKFNIPFAQTQAGKSEVPFSFDKQMCVGAVGICGTSAANRLIQKSDLIIAIGTKLNDFVTGSKFFFSNNIPVVSINANRMDSLKVDALSVVCDSKVGINKISEQLNKVNYKASYTNEVETAKKDWLDELAKIKLEQGKNGFSQASVLVNLNECLADSDIIVSASGSMPSDLERLWRPKNPGTYHLEYGFSCMGYEISGAVGAKIACPESEVFAFIGDGVFLLTHSDLVTSLQEGIKINVILFDNNGHQCINNLQQSQGISTFGTEFRYREASTNMLSGGYIPIDFCGVASAYGAKTYKASTMEELKAAVEDAKKQEVSTFIEIKVDKGTMTKSYDTFWRVGTASTSKSKTVAEAYEKLNKTVQELKKY